MSAILLKDGLHCLHAGTADREQVIAAEICRDHLFDPQTVTPTLPAGYRLVLAAETANADRYLEALLLTSPRYKSYAVGSLCFVSVGNFVVDGISVHSASPMPMAFWWAVTEGPRHASMRGKASWVQLGSWYPADTQHRTTIMKTDPMAQFVELDLKQVERNTWRLRLALPGETVEAEVRNSGQRTGPSATQPGYMSVPLSGGSASYFLVFTYSGHLHRSAQGTWRAVGSGVFSDALAIPNESSVFRTVFQEGWTARSGLYRFEP